MANFTLDWVNDAGANGTYTLDNGAQTLGVSVATVANAAGQTANTQSNGSPAENGLWVSGLTDQVSTTMTFDQAVENLSFEVYDIDQRTGSWDDKLTIIALDADGNEVLVSFSDLDGLHTATGGQLDADGNASTGVETSGAADSVTVNIPGPIVSLTFVFNHGESASNSGIFGISGMNFATAPDYVVEGTAGADLIDDAYLGDPEGDKIDAGDSATGNDDDSVEAGDGDDTVRAGLGDDTVHGGLGDDVIHGDEGADSLLGDAGNDSIYGAFGDDYVEGGAGDDHLEGNEGADTLIGGAGNDWMRGSYDNDELWGGEGDDYLWGGYGDDTFHIENNFGNDTIAAEDVDEVSGDTLDLSAVTDDLTIDLSNANPETGSFTDGTSTATFEEVENIVLGAGTDTLVLADLGGADRVQSFAAPTDNGDGTFTGHDRLDVSALTDASGAPVNTADVTVSDDGSGNAVLTFPSGASLTLVGIAPAAVSSPAALAAMGIPMPDYVVEGTGGADLIDAGYAGDPEGDAIDAGDNAAGNDDDMVIAGAGNDTVFSGAGNDDVDAGTGNDSVDSGDGNDTVTGGAGDDTIQGWFGDDQISGGEGADSLVGWTGSDTIAGGAGADTIEAGDDEDLITLDDGFGSDLIDGGDGGTDFDRLDLSNLTGDLTVDLTGNESGSVSDGASTATFTDIERVMLGGGRDTVVLADGSGADEVEGFDTRDSGDGTAVDQLDVTGLSDIDGNPVNAADVTVTDTNGDGTGDAILVFPNGEQITLVGVPPSAVSTPAQLAAIGIPPNPLDYVVEGTAGDDVIDVSYTGDPDGDMVDNNDAADGSNDDVIEAGAGNDTVFAGAGDDSVTGGLGDDTLHGGAGADRLSGGVDDDYLAGEDGDDSLAGGAGADTLSGGAGADTLTGGDDSDRFTDLTAGDHVEGGAGGVDHDILDLSGALSPGGSYTVTRTTDSDGNGFDGTVTLYDASGAVDGVIDFTNIEEIVPCFTPGTGVATARGVVPVETLREGDKVITRDNGYREIRWIGRREVDTYWLARAPHLHPVLIRKGALGPDMPATDMRVSPNHRMLITGAKAMMHVGEPEVLVAAKHLVGLDGVETELLPQVTYLHMLFDEHEVIYAGGAWSESFQPGDYSLSGIGAEQRAEIYALFPELRGVDFDRQYLSTRRILKRHEAAMLRLG